MKNDLTCAVVRDLLPAYVEGLTAEETAQAVERHLASCPDCARLRTELAAPAAEEPAETAREVDYLKKVKRRSWKRAVLAAAATLLLVLAAVGVKIFVIGTPAMPQELTVTGYTETAGVLTLQITTPFSATAHRGWTVETEDGVAAIWARSVLPSPLFPVGGGTVEVPLEGVTEIRLCGRTVWQDGMAIPARTMELLEKRTPYVGDAPALGAIAGALEISDRVGGYTMSLQTSREPYGWTLHFEEKLSLAEEKRMVGCAYQMLALVENLDCVRWTSGNDQGEMTQDYADQALARMTEEYNAACGTAWPVLDSVKDYADSPVNYQRLLCLLREFVDDIS